MKFFTSILLTLLIAVRCLASTTPFADDFANTSSWTASGMTVASGEVKASVDNSTVGTLTRDADSAVGGSTERVGFDIVVDTSMTTNTYVSVALLDSASGIGHGVYIKQGVGICSGKYLTTPGFTSTTLLAWGLLTNGGRYHVEWTCNPASKYAFFSLYDPSGNLVTRSSVNDTLIDWFNVQKLRVDSNSTKSTISRLAIDPNLTGGPTTGKYFSNVAKYTAFLTSANVMVDVAHPGTGVDSVDFYIPGGGNVSEEAIYFRGAGQTPTLSEITTYPTGAAVLNGFLQRGAMVVVPSLMGTSGGGDDSWGNDFGAAQAAEAIRYANTLIGNAQAPLNFVCYSMGTLTGVRLIAYDGEVNVKSLYMRSSVCDLAYMEQSSGFASAIDTAWGVSHQGSLGAAQTTFARGNPIGLLGSNPAAFAPLSIYMNYSTTGDTTVTQANNCVAFDALLVTKGIAHQSSIKPYMTHTEAGTVGDAEAHLAQLGSEAKVSAADIAAIWANSSRTLSDKTGFGLSSSERNSTADAFIARALGTPSAGTVGKALSQAGQLTFTTPNVVDATGGGGSGATTTVDNTKVVQSRVRKLGTRADGVTVAFPDIQPRTGETLPWWIDTTAFAGGEWIESISNVATSDASAVVITKLDDGVTAKAGVNREYGVVWLTPVWTSGHEAADITFDLTPRSGETIKVTMHAKKPTQ